MNKFLCNIICGLIPSKKLRHKFRKYLKYLQYKKENIENFTKYKKILEKFEIIHCNKNFDKNSPKILHYSTYNIQCGIATFLNDFIKGFENNGFGNNDIIPINHDIRKNVLLYLDYLNLLIQNSKNYDYIILQHEYGLYNCNYYFSSFEHNIIQNFLEKIDLDKNLNYESTLISSLIFTDYIITNLLEQNKKVSIIWHTTFQLAIRDLVANNVELNFKKFPVFRYFDNKNLKIFVMTNDMLNALKKYKIPVDNVNFMEHPIPTKKFDISKDKVDSIKQNYNIKENDIILGQFGFVGYSKGNINILKAMKHLPQNFKYIMVGGKHQSDNSDYYDNILKYIKDNNLEKRVFITGFIKEEDVVSYLSIVNLATYVYNTDVNFASGSINQMFLYNIPVLASNGISFADLKNHYDCLEITNNSEQPEKLAEDIQNLLKNNDRIDMLRKNMQKFCEDNTFKNFTNKLLGVINNE